jgi:hypothetical protein
LICNVISVPSGLHKVLEIKIFQKEVRNCTAVKLSNVVNVRDFFFLKIGKSKKHQTPDQGFRDHALGIF